MLLLKIGAEAVAGAISGAVAIFGLTDSTAITSGGLVALFGLGGVFVRQFSKGQRTYLEAYRLKEAEAELAKDETHYTHWEMERLRYSYGERVMDPGPYIPRRPPPEKESAPRGAATP